MSKDENEKSKKMKSMCPSCGENLFQAHTGHCDGVRKVGCPLCGVWGDNALTPAGAMNNFRIEIGLGRSREDDNEG